tara:strand:- start:385 stop:759 length:375 start_codon:yes stop_codon:yes gene_type:complete
MEKLTEKQKKFCETYVSNNFNGAQAAIAAGYSKNSSRSMGSQLLTKLNVQKYIEKLKEKTAKQLNITRESQVQELNELKQMAKELAEVNNAIKAIEVQNKMLGLNEPETVNINQYTATVKFADR